MNPPRFILVSVFALVFAFVLIGQCAATFQMCPSPHGKVEAIRVDNCTDKMAFCVLKRGTNASIEVDFVPNFNASSVKVKIFGEVAGVPIPFGIEPDEACDTYGLECPLATNETSTFALSLPIMETYPPIKVKIQIKLIDETNTPVACVKFPAKILM